MRRLALFIVCALMLAGCVAPQIHRVQRLPKHFMEHRFDGREWKVGYQAGNMQELISEWVVGNETVNDWSELLTAHVQYSAVSIAEVTSQMQEMLARDCQTFKAEIISQDDTSILWVWSHDGCQGYPAQREILKIMSGTDGTYSLSYAVKEESYSEKNYNTWLEIITDAGLKPFP